MKLSFYRPGSWEFSLDGRLFQPARWPANRNRMAAWAVMTRSCPFACRHSLQEVCQASGGNPANCDAGRAYDDVERYMLISTGSHMSRVRSMVRSSRKYQLH